MKFGFVNGLFRAIEHGLKNHVFKPIKLSLKLQLARRYRSALRVFGRVCFIGITGSCGKTTTTELVAAILAGEGRVQKGSHENTALCFVRTILAVTPRHRFCVSEISAERPGVMEKATRLLQPQIGVVTHIGQDHYGNFRSLEATAAEKGKLVEALPAAGVAVLNVDDPYVYSMRKRTRARIITYGLSAEAMVRGENVSCAWPTPMSLDVCYARQQLHLQTRLLGEHWACTVLAALAAAGAAGVPLERAAPAVESFDPVPYRMSTHETSDGVVFISDTWKAPLWTIPACLDFLRKARARRKILVIASISDTPKGFYHRYKTVIRQAWDAADKIIFVGEHAGSALRARPHSDNDRVLAFDTLYRLNAFLSEYLRAGDLVLLKGSERADHLHRIVLARMDSIACWRENCGKHRYCRECRHLHSPAGPG